MPDKLAMMLSLQHSLQKDSYGIDPKEMEDADRVAFITWNVLALTDELHEALGEIGWKPWATSRHINVEALQGELVDAWHFFMNLCLAAGLTEDVLLRKYLVKNAINASRQKDGYDGVSTKCPQCQRALDDPATLCTQYACEESFNE
jgi:dimeric dUTPase (all-alpha-NTP-PPase superfamily)